MPEPAVSMVFERLDRDSTLLRASLTAQPYPLLFVTISGAHLYGFPSADSDYDLRGVHILPVEEVIGLRPPRETIESTGREALRESSDERATQDDSEGGRDGGNSPADGIDLDLVTHDARKFFRLMLKRNGYVLEQLFSPLVLHTTPEHDELKSIARRCITRHHAHHYLGFARTQWRLFENSPKATPAGGYLVKPLLYVYRVLLTGIHLMRTGEVEGNLVRLNESFKLPHVAELIARKLAGPEKATLPAADVAFHRREAERLSADLEAARDSAALPDAPAAATDLHNLLLRLRLKARRSP